MFATRVVVAAAPAPVLPLALEATVVHSLASCAALVDLVLLVTSHSRLPHRKAPSAAAVFEFLLLISFLVCAQPRRAPCGPVPHRSLPPPCSTFVRPAGRSRWRDPFATALGPRGLPRHSCTQALMLTSTTTMDLEIERKFTVGSPFKPSSLPHARIHVPLHPITTSLLLIVQDGEESHSRCYSVQHDWRSLCPRSPIFARLRPESQ